MSTSQYMSGRKKYSRPQGLLFSDNPGTIIDGKYVPVGAEIGEASTDTKEFLILSDDNRAPIDFDIQRLEKRERMVNGRMRSYHIADKLRLSVSWNMLPSRSFFAYPNFNPNDGSSTLEISGKPSQKDLQYTTDGGAGGVEILDWYENHKGPFWVFLSYDKNNEFSGTSKYNHIKEYNQIVEVYISDFKYSVQKRGSLSHDFWNISFTLEEV